jgi:hypothetical protein
LKLDFTPIQEELNMCTVINADYLLATILSDKKSVSFGSLKEIQNKIQARVRNVVVDISSPAVQAALKYYPEIFEKNEDSITKAADADKYLTTKYLDNEFTSSVSVEIHKIVKEAIAASVT